MSDQNILHITEISYRVHITNPVDRKEFIDALRNSIIKHKEQQGAPGYIPGTLTIGWFIPYRAKTEDWYYKKDYKFLKLKCSNVEDFNILKDIRFIEHKGTLARIMPKMSPE